MTKKRLFKTTVIMGFSHILFMLLQVIRSKIIALIIGPEGVGVLGNSLVLLSFLENLCFLGFHIALLRFGSEKAHKKRFNSISKFLSTTILTHIITSTLAIAIGLIFINQINLSIYKSLAFVPLSILVIASPLFRTLNADFRNLFNSFNRIKILAKINIISAIVGLSTIIPLIIFFGIKGAIISIFFETIIIFGIVFYFYKKHFIKNIKIKKALANKKTFFKMLKYGGANQIAILINSASSFVIRALITTKLLLSSAGIFHASMKIGTYLMIIKKPIGIYFYPKISSIYKNKEGMKKEINNTIRFTTIIITPIMCLVVLFSDMLIRILYSIKFLAIIPLLIWVIIGKFMDLLAGILGTPLFITQKFKVYLFINTIFNIILIGLSYFLLNELNLIGVVIAQTISHGIIFFLYLIASFKIFKFQLTKRNMILIISGIVICVITYPFTYAPLYLKVVPLLLVFIWLIYSTNKREREITIKYIKNSLMQIKYKIIK